MAATNKKLKKASTATNRGSGVAAKRTKRAATKRTKRAHKREGKSIVQLRRFKAAKPTAEVAATVFPVLRFPAR